MQGHTWPGTGRCAALRLDVVASFPSPPLREQLTQGRPTRITRALLSRQAPRLCVLMNLQPSSPNTSRQTSAQGLRPFRYADHSVGRLHGMASTLEHAKPSILRQRAVDWLHDEPARLCIAPDEPSVAHPRALVMALPALCDHVRA